MAHTSDGPFLFHRDIVELWNLVAEPCDVSLPSVHEGRP